MSLRTDWSKMKSAADTAFKMGTGKAAVDAVMKGGNVPSNPLKFKEDLGPTLDKYEAAKTPADKKKYGDAAKKVIVSYKAMINKEKAVLDSADKSIVVVLVKTLNEIEGKIK